MAHKSLKSIIYGLFSGAVITSLGFAMGSKNPSTAGPRIAKSVPESQRQLLRKDQQALMELSFNPASVRLPDGKDLHRETARILGVSSISQQSLSDWLAQRVHFIVGESFDSTGKNLYPVARNHVYENASEMPLLEHDQGPSTGRGIIGMSNLGAGIYLRGKRERTLYGLKIPGIGKLKISSPRVGLLSVGEGLFSIRYAPNTYDAAAYANSLHRLATVFHEARHGDGHGKSLSFFHAICPSGQYRGIPACDRNLNGPYTVQALVLQTLAENCRTERKCTAGELETLRLTYLDAFSRVIRITPIAEENATQQIAILEQTLRACELLSREVRATLPDLCGDMTGMELRLSRLRESIGQGIPSIEWDPRPEGLEAPIRIVGGGGGGS